MDQDIEDLIEQMTKVRPEVLQPEALKLFKRIMKLLDERDMLLEKNKQLEENYKIAVAMLTRGTYPPEADLGNHIPRAD
jgi:hypothetical protein